MNISDAALYDWTHRGNDGDVDWYQRLCDKGKSVLELGCGSGRITIPIASLGHDITGLDNEVEALERLQQAAQKKAGLSENLRLVQGDMRAFQLKHQYGRIFLPFNSLFLLQSDQEVLDCFRCVKQHLEPDGLFAFDIHWVDESISESDDPDVWFPCLVIRLPEGDISVSENREWFLEEQKVRLTYRYEFWDGRLRELSLTQRYLSRFQCASLLEQSGLKIKKSNADFQDLIVSEFSEQMLFVVGH